MTRRIAMASIIVMLVGLMALGVTILMGLPFPGIIGKGQQAQGVARLFGVVPLVLGGIGILGFFPHKLQSSERAS